MCLKLHWLPSASSSQFCYLHCLLLLPLMDWMSYFRVMVGVEREDTAISPRPCCGSHFIRGLGSLPCDLLLQGHFVLLWVDPLPTTSPASGGQVNSQTVPSAILCILLGVWRASGSQCSIHTIISGCLSLLHDVILQFLFHCCYFILCKSFLRHLIFF